ncbi:hypothetical protein LINPERHAP1_LOCUS21287 [Linum perenne]
MCLKQEVSVFPIGVHYVYTTRNWLAICLFTALLFRRFGAKSVRDFPSLGLFQPRLQS